LESRHLQRTLIWAGYARFYMRWRLPIPIFALLLSLGCVDVDAQAAFLVHGKLIDPSGAAMSTAPVQLQTNAGVLVAETTSSITGVSDFVAVKAGAHALKVPACNGFEAMAVPILIATQVQNMGSVKDIQALLRQLRADTTANEYMQALPESVQEMVGSRNFFLGTRFGD
jgi:hypothetical protein